MIFNKKTRIAAGLAALASVALVLGACAATDASENGKVDYTKMSAEELGEYLLMESGSFRHGPGGSGRGHCP
jgi:L-cysteine S-thiosulfotransferase